MTNGTTNTGIANVAKQQRSTQLHPDIFRLISACEARTGARFNRQVLAALLQYYFDRPDGPDPTWMQYAVALDNGEISVGDIPECRLNDETAVALSLHTEPDGDVPQDAVVLDNECRRRCGQWKKIVKSKGDDPIANIVEHWASTARKR